MNRCCLSFQLSFIAIEWNYNHSYFDIWFCVFSSNRDMVKQRKIVATLYWLLKNCIVNVFAVIESNQGSSFKST